MPQTDFYNFESSPVNFMVNYSFLPPAVLKWITTLWNCIFLKFLEDNASGMLSD